MSQRLASARVKIKRADKHLTELKEATEAYIGSNPYRIIRQDDDESGRIIYRLRILVALPDELSAIAGDVIHNLRSALDHLAWALVVENGGTPDRQTAFPILGNPNELKSAIRGRVKGASARAMSLIERLKPYEGGTEPFWILHQLDNVDKHRLLVTLTASNQAVIIDFGERMRQAFGEDSSIDPTQFPSMPVGLRPADRCVEDDATLFIDKTTDGMNVEPKFTMSVALHEPGVVDCEPVVPLLLQLLDFTKRVATIFERFCF